MQFAVESFLDVAEDISELIPKHKDEVGMFGDDIDLNPKWHKYEAMDKAGILHIITMRKEGKLLGYYLSIIFPHLHYDFTIAANDILYIDKGYRGNALAFFRYVQKTLKAKGVTVMAFNIKPIVDFRNVAEYLGFELLEYTYFKRLDLWQEQSQ